MKILLVSAVVILFASCAHKPEFKTEMLEIKEAQIAFDGKALSQDKIEEDVDFTIWALGRAYAGAEHLPATHLKLG